MQLCLPRMNILRSLFLCFRSSGNPLLISITLFLSYWSIRGITTRTLLAGVWWHHLKYPLCNVGIRFLFIVSDSITYSFSLMYIPLFLIITSNAGWHFFNCETVASDSVVWFFLRRLSFSTWELEHTAIHSLLPSHNDFYIHHKYLYAYLSVVTFFLDK